MTSDDRPQRPTATGLRIALWLLWAAGLGINGFLAWKLAARGSHGSLALPGCTATGFDCESVLTSPYSSVFNVSLTTWAFAYYAAVFVILLLERRVRPFAALLLPVVAAPALVAALWFTYVMHVRLREYCPWCLADHALNAAFFIVAVAHARSTWRAEQEQRAATGTAPLGTGIVHLTVNTGILLAAWAGTVLVFMHQSTALNVVAHDGRAQPFEALSFEAAGTALPTIAGDSNSPRRVVMFSCPTCSHCRRVHALLQEISQTDPLRIEMRFAPLDPTCNSTWSTEEKVSDAHREACELVRIALAVAAVDGKAFDAFAHWLYENQRGMSAATATIKAKETVGAARFDAAIHSDAVAARLAADVQLAQQLQITAVPRLFVPSGELKGAIMRENLAATLRRVFQ